MDNSVITGRHPSLPDHLTPEALQQWIINTSSEKFTHTTKKYLSADEVSELEHESSGNGRAINKLMIIMDTVSTMIKKGSEEPLDIHIPATVGTKKFDTFRKQNDDLIEKGFEEQECEVYGIVNHEAEQMEYFTLDGGIVEERTRNLSIKEQHQYLTKRPAKAVLPHPEASLTIQKGAGPEEEDF